MTCFNKEHYKELKELAELDSVIVFTYKLPSDNEENIPYNGFSVAFTKPRDGLRMVQASVSYCSPEDKFKRKHGKYQALLKMYSGNSVSLPLGAYSIYTIEKALEDLFLIY